MCCYYSYAQLGLGTVGTAANSRKATRATLLMTIMTAGAPTFQRFSAKKVELAACKTLGSHWMHCAADIGVRLVSASHNAQSKSIGYACINANERRSPCGHRWDRRASQPRKSGEEINEDR